MPSHSHAITLNVNAGEDFSYYSLDRHAATNNYSYSRTSANTGGSSSHTHTLSGTAIIALNVKYTDVIVCSKN